MFVLFGFVVHLCPVTVLKVLPVVQPCVGTGVVVVACICCIRLPKIFCISACERVGAEMAVGPEVGVGVVIVGVGGTTTKDELKAV